MISKKIGCVSLNTWEYRHNRPAAFHELCELCGSVTGRKHNGVNCDKCSHGPLCFHCLTACRYTDTDRRLNPAGFNICFDQGLIEAICWECHNLPLRSDQAHIKRALCVASKLFDAMYNTGPWFSWKSDFGMRKMHEAFLVTCDISHPHIIHVTCDTRHVACDT